MARRDRHGFDQSGLRVEDPNWMRETRLRRLVRPLAKVVNAFQYEPARDGMFGVRSDGSVIPPMSMGDHAIPSGGDEMLGKLAAQDLANDPEGYGDVAAG